MWACFHKWNKSFFSFWLSWNCQNRVFRPYLKKSLYRTTPSMFSLLSRMKQIILLFFWRSSFKLSSCKNKRKVAMTIGMFSSTMPMFLTFLVNKLYKKWRKLFKFGGDKSMINLRIEIFEDIFTIFTGFVESFGPTLWWH